VDALDKGRVERLDGGRGVALEEGLDVFLEGGLEELLFPWLLAERLELLNGIIVCPFLPELLVHDRGRVGPGAHGGSSTFT